MDDSQILIKLDVILCTINELYLITLSYIYLMLFQIIPYFHEWNNN